MAVSPANLERYRDFVGKHSTNGVYNPEKGLGGLLSTLTPDPKPVVLAGMQTEVLYFTVRQLYQDVGVWLGNQGLSRRAFPIKHASTWSYCECRQDQVKVDGSLVEIGAVVKQSYWQSAWGEFRTGYTKSLAGAELAVPLLPYVCEFVSDAREYGERQSLLGKPPHQFDSMWRVLGAVQSINDNRRPLVVFQVIQFLINNPGKYRETDIFETIGINPHVASFVLNNLGEIGLIDYDSPHRDSQGKKVQGWSAYKPADLQRLTDIDALFREIKGIRSYFNDRGYLARLAKYIQDNPTRIYEHNVLAAELGLSKGSTSRLLSVLTEIGVLESATEMKGKSVVSQAAANDLTRMFYDEVLLPVKEVAATLTPLSSKPLDPKKLETFLGNYQEERSSIGLQGGREAREQLIMLLTGVGSAKLSYLIEMYNRRQDRKLDDRTIGERLKDLIQQGLVKKTAKGYYELV